MRDDENIYDEYDELIDILLTNGRYIVFDRSYPMARICEALERRGLMKQSMYGRYIAYIPNPMIFNIKQIRIYFDGKTHRYKNICQSAQIE